jgi:hypothetical protein
MSENTTKLVCRSCKHVYWADIAGLPDASTEDSVIHNACPVCDHEEATIEE